MKTKHKTLTELERPPINWETVILAALWVLLTVWACSRAWQVANHKPQTQAIETNVEDYK